MFVGRKEREILRLESNGILWPQFVVNFKNLMVPCVVVDGAAKKKSRAMKKTFRSGTA